ncbi:NUDIX hydrolase [Paramuribaculum intestinale]|uniref:NUDIX hydrolase n=1 Tax=Paramuribaculum intestinale TaxID=2094151 RepID=UPI00272A78DF|nr:NUDIX domain-containing protein [Paramuribaculum intestinale]
MNDELFPVVDENGDVIGSATRGECHSGSMKLHPVVHLHVIDRDGRILLQRRSPDKDIQPGRWDTAVGGHVDYGESVRDALMRESREELGIDASAAVEVTHYVFQSQREREYVNTFFLRVDADDFKACPDPVEISEIRFWTVDEIRGSLGLGELTPNFEMEFSRLLPELLLN